MCESDKKINYIFIVIDLFDDSCRRIQFPLVAANTSISPIGQNTVATFKELLTLMHSISETFLDLCSLKKNMSGVLSKRDMSILFGYSDKYGTGLEYAALYFRCVLDPLLRAHNVFLQSNNLSVGTLMNIACKSLSETTHDFFCVHRYRQDWLRKKLELTNTIKNLRKLESLVTKIYDSVQEIPNLMFRYSSSLPLGHSDKKVSAEAAMNLMEYINRMMAYSFSSSVICSINDHGIVSREVSDKRKLSLDHFGLYYSDKCEYKPIFHS